MMAREQDHLSEGTRCGSEGAGGECEVAAAFQTENTTD